MTLILSFRVPYLAVWTSCIAIMSKVPKVVVHLQGHRKGKVYTTGSTLCGSVEFSIPTHVRLGCVRIQFLGRSHTFKEGHSFNMVNNHTFLCIDTEISEHWVSASVCQDTANNESRGHCQLTLPTRYLPNSSFRIHLSGCGRMSKEW